MTIRIMPKRSKIHSNQKGIVSIIVTLITMVLITIIVMTYSQVINREQRQTIDRQLNSQAYYTGEATINTIISAVDNNAYTVASISGNKCSGPDSSIYKMKNAFPPIVLPTGISSGAVTCLLINRDENSLVYDSVEKDNSQSIHIITRGATDISRIEVGWDGTNPATSTPPVGSGFTKLAEWSSSYPPVLKVDIVPWGASNTAQSLLDSSQAFYLYPTDGTGTGYSVEGGDSKGEIVSGKCSASNSPKFCRATMYVVPGKDFYVRVRPIYSAATVSIIAQDSTSSSISLSESQTVIDVTTKVGGITKRISARRSFTLKNLTPSFSIDSATEICKKIKINAIGAIDTDCLSGSGNAKGIN
ncbi:MAG: hypothetical protein WCJ86_00260 [Candidatus Saccharibacteria bacterium]